MQAGRQLVVRQNRTLSPEGASSCRGSPPRRWQHFPEKLKALLAIAAEVLVDGKRVTTALVEATRREGATDIEVHDTVLIAAAFCMYNRYVDGLGTWQPPDEQMYADMGKRMAEEGYSRISTPK